MTRRPRRSKNSWLVSGRACLGVAARRARVAVLVVDEDQVDVGRHVQFGAAQLAHAHDQQVLRDSVGADGNTVHWRQFVRMHRDSAACRATSASAVVV